jgi:hypothetical protein
MARRSLTCSWRFDRSEHRTFADAGELEPACAFLIGRARWYANFVCAQIKWLAFGLDTFATNATTLSTRRS